MTVFLEITDLLRIVERLRVGPVRDLGILSSSAHRPQTRLYGRIVYPTIFHQGAALLESLSRNHPLVDGNKRLAWLALVVFFDLNRMSIVLDDDSAYDYVIRVCTGSMSLDDSAAFLEAHHQRVDP